MKKQVYNPETKQYEWQEMGAANNSKLYGDFHKDTVRSRGEVERIANTTRGTGEKRTRQYLKAVINRSRFKKFISKTDTRVREELNG